LIVLNLKKLIIGIIGSVCLYLIINNYIVEVSILKYIAIETLITVAHLIYDKGIKSSIEEAPED
jgi:hypothetical protein